MHTHFLLAELSFLFRRTLPCGTLAFYLRANVAIILRYGSTEYALKHIEIRSYLNMFFARDFFLCGGSDHLIFGRI